MSSPRPAPAGRFDAGRCAHRAGDVGMHLLLAPARTPVPGTSAALMAAALRRLFERTGTRRVVVEPDVRNEAVHRLHARAGFAVHGPLALPGRTALLSTCTREQFAASELAGTARPVPPSGELPGAPAHLGLHPMRIAHRHLSKALAELAHERLLRPEPVGDGVFEVRAGRARYRFRARPAAALARAGFQEAEAAMTEGHPGFVANNGRIGLGVTEHDRYAPEAARPVRLVWVAAHRAQQSVRTFCNTTRPERHYVETALAVQNMGFLRGLSPRYMRDTPAINDWVAELVAADPVLAEAGFSVLREVAVIGYTGDAYHRAAASGHGEEGPHTRMLAALGRESPVGRTGPGERLATLASLLHVDAFGTPLVSVHVRESGLSAEDWVRRLLGAYLAPVARCLLAAGTFWELAAQCLQAVAEADPAGADKVPLFASRFEHSCLNRLQLLNTLQMVDLTDQASSLQYAGTLENPVSARVPVR